MPRRSIESLTLVGDAPVQPIPLPSVPAGLTEAEAKLCQAVIESKPSDWFDDANVPILTEYVRAACMSDNLARAIAEAGPVKRLLDMRDREARRAVSLATKLRLTVQSKRSAHWAATANKRVGGKRPWHTPSDSPQIGQGATASEACACDDVPHSTENCP